MTHIITDGDTIRKPLAFVTVHREKFTEEIGALLDTVFTKEIV
jgi:hypothetical protein